MTNAVNPPVTPTRPPNAPTFADCLAELIEVAQDEGMHPSVVDHLRAAANVVSETSAVAADTPAE